MKTDKSQKQVECPICGSEAKCFHTGILDKRLWDSRDDLYYLKCSNCGYHLESPGKKTYDEENLRAFCPFCSLELTRRRDYQMVIAAEKLWNIMLDYYYHGNVEQINTSSFDIVDDQSRKIIKKFDLMQTDYSPAEILAGMDFPPTEIPDLNSMLKEIEAVLDRVPEK